MMICTSSFDKICMRVLNLGTDTGRCWVLLLPSGGRLPLHHSQAAAGEPAVQGWFVYHCGRHSRHHPGRTPKQRPRPRLPQVGFVLNFIVEQQTAISNELEWNGME
eukprot:scaffold166670_cov19-Prasinocladus_malaysianus.AAC.1